MNNYEAAHTNSAPRITESSSFRDISADSDHKPHLCRAGLSCSPQSSSLPDKLLHILHFAFLKPSFSIKLLWKNHL